MLFIFRRLLGAAEGDLEEAFDLRVEDKRVADQLKQVYLGNELLPIPVLLEVSKSLLSQRVYVNIRPDFFVGEALTSRLEGELRVLGSVRYLVPDGNEGFLSAEEWLLHDWEHMMRRKAMTTMSTVVKDMVDHLQLDLPAEDVHAYIKGPAIVVDAIALY